MTRTRTKLFRISRLAAASAASLLAFSVMASPAQAETAGPPTYVVAPQTTQTVAGSATVSAQLNIHTDTSAALTLKWGTTTSYGQTLTKTVAGTLTSGGWYSAPFTFTLSPLAAGTIYHYQITAVTAHGSYVTGDKGFVMFAPPTLTSVSSFNQGGGNVGIFAQAKLYSDSSATFSIKYGPTTSYGFSVPSQVKAGTNNNPGYSASVSFKLTGLAPGAKYHYIVTVSTTYGTTSSTDQLITMPAMTWTTPAGAPSGHLDGISCVSTTFCIAIGEATPNNMVSYLFNGTSWSLQATLSNDSSAAASAGVDCLSTTFCLAVFLNGETWKFDGSTWTSQPTAPAGTSAGWDSLPTVECLSSTLCLMVNHQANIYRFNGQSWNISPGSSTNGLWTGLSCTSVQFCVAAADTSAAPTPTVIGNYNGSSWSLLNPFPQDQDVFGTDPVVSCSQPTSCVLGSTQQAGAWSGDGIHWTPDNISSPGLGIPTAVSCASNTFCAVADSGSADVQIWDGHSWTEYPNVSIFRTPVSCVSAGFCAVGAEIGRA